MMSCRSTFLIDKVPILIDKVPALTLRMCLFVRIKLSAVAFFIVTLTLHAL